MAHVPSRAPGSLWMMRYPQTYPNGYVRTIDNERIVIAQFENDTDIGQSMVLDRKDARLLAKRINECLDATVIR